MARPSRWQDNWSDQFDPAKTSSRGWKSPCERSSSQGWSRGLATDHENQRAELARSVHRAKSSGPVAERSACSAASSDPGVSAPNDSTRRRCGASERCECSCCRAGCATMEPGDCNPAESCCVRAWAMLQRPDHQRACVVLCDDRWVHHVDHSWRDTSHSVPCWCILGR